MTISSGGFNLPSPSFSPTPTHFEQETSARFNLQNQGQIGKGNVVIVPQSQLDEVPLSKLAERNTWNYRSDASRPSLKSVGQNRMNAPELLNRDAGWQGVYNSLIGTVQDKDLAQELNNPTLPETRSLLEVFETSARGIEWLAGASASLETESAQKKGEENREFTGQGFLSAKALGEEILEAVNRNVDIAGLNLPEHGEVKELSTNFQELLGETDNG